MIISVLVVIFIFGVMNFYFSIQILRRVAKTEVRMNFFELRWQVHKQMKLYCQLTKSETGRIGGAWYGYWISLVIMLMTILWFFSLLSQPAASPL